MLLCLQCNQVLLSAIQMGFKRPHFNFKTAADTVGTRASTVHNMKTGFFEMKYPNQEYAALLKTSSQTAMAYKPFVCD